MNHPPFRIVFAVFPGMTQLDFTGPYQFLSRLPDSRACPTAGALWRAGMAAMFPPKG